MIYGYKYNTEQVVTGHEEREMHQRATHSSMIRCTDAGRVGTAAPIKRRLIHGPSEVKPILQIFMIQAQRVTVNLYSDFELS